MFLATVAMEPEVSGHPAYVAAAHAGVAISMLKQGHDKASLYHLRKFLSVTVTAPVWPLCRAAVHHLLAAKCALAAGMTFCLYYQLYIF